MLVSLYPNFNQNKRGNIKKNNLKTNYANNLMARDKVSFGAIDPITLIEIVAKYGIIEGFKGGVKTSSVLTFKKGIADVLDSPNSYKSRLLDTIFALSKTPADFGKEVEKSFFYEYVRDFKNIGWAENSDIGTMQEIALDKLFPLLDDGVGAHREAKKALMLATLDHHTVTLSTYPKNFKQLNDSWYQHFKEQLLDKCLYSPEFLRKTCYTEQNKGLFNMELLETLDRRIYADYIRRNQPEITREKQVLFQEAKEHLMSYTGGNEEFWKKVYRNDVYKKYKKGFNSYGCWAKYEKLVFRAMVEQLGFNKAKVAKLFNLTPKKAEIIIKDMKKTKISCLNKMIVLFQNNNLTNFQVHKPTFKSGLTPKMMRKIQQADVLEISGKLAGKGIPTDFKGNKVVAWHCSKIVEILEQINERFRRTFALPKGIYLEAFEKLNLNTEDKKAIGFCNLRPTKLIKGDDRIIPSRVLYFDTFEQKPLYDWKNINEISDCRYETGQSGTDFFLDAFIHEFVHVSHEDRLLSKLGGKKLLEKINFIEDKQQITEYQRKYGQKVSQICDYALENPFEAVACDMSRVIIDALDKETLMPTRNPFIGTSYENLSFWQRVNIPNYSDEQRPLQEILRRFWNGKFE